MFHVLCSVLQILLDYITTLGYPQKSHSLCSTYPRVCVSTDPDKTLADLSLTTACTLNVEEKD